MDKVEEVERIKREAVEVRLTPSKLCERAGIARTTWWRAQQRPESLTLDLLDKLEGAIRSKRAEVAKA